MTGYEYREFPLSRLAAGSALALIGGGSHMLLYEKPFYRQFQESIVLFLQTE